VEAVIQGEPLKRLVCSCSTVSCVKVDVSLFSQYEIMNTWYVASRVMPLYRARKMNDSGWFHPSLPSLDPFSIVYTGQPASMFAFDWAQKVMELSFGTKPQVEHSKCRDCVIILAQPELNGDVCLQLMGRGSRSGPQTSLCASRKQYSQGHLQLW
jgi:hypothetical protein